MISLLGAGCVSLPNTLEDKQTTKENEFLVTAPQPKIQPSSTAVSVPNVKTEHDGRTFTYSKAAPEFELVCTSPCKVDDREFLDAFFIGMKEGILALKEATGGVMPKQKIEYHPGQDGDCFKNGYGEHPTGYVSSFQGKSLICSSDYYWYKKLQGTSEERTLSYYRTLASQTLTIHEAIHPIFNDYTTQGSNPPVYEIQESFAKVVSLDAVGTITGYGDPQFIGGFTIENPPPRDDRAHRSNFFVYSLHKRFGFNPEYTKMFFQQYTTVSDEPISGNAKVKMILDKILGVNTQESFNDIYVEMNN